MAMIKCPKCNEEISDKAIRCIHCDNILVKKGKSICKECGSEIKNGENFCGKCGCPVSDKKEILHPQKVEVTKVTLWNNLSREKRIIGIISILAVIGIIAGIIVVNKDNEKQLNEQYKENLSTITYKMLDGAASAENCGNQIKSVWYNTIYKKDDYKTNKYTKTYGVFNDDFNDSLSKLFSDSTFISLTDEVEENIKEVSNLMKKMKNPPEEWEEAYDELKDYYDDYLTLTNLCINPTGSLNTYSSNFNDADSDVLNGYNKMKTYLDY